MAVTIFDFETNKNAVIMWYNNLSYGPRYDGDKAYGCMVRFHEYTISTTIYRKGFQVFKNSTDKPKLFSSLKEAKNFIISQANKKRTLFG